ncbi:hypothetical protein RBU49_13970 [Clostridium sp. MB40-C1]|uniref:hypothetical protein n=1 Tax=Clostridium sp. MB40-C1 TaxID=3070996 RepID=UPI0027DFA7BB|nr:hypothetical protein [Clostridium sp. MB40-C1]WMJ79964.1 hypothetical protein RBU49_13970 [Clostridium sp. MB40-C1]
MQISLYIGRRKKKDKIVDDELEKYVEGDRSDRIKDLILKGLIFEGRHDIDNKLLDMRYIYNNNDFLGAMERGSKGNINIPVVNIKDNSPALEKPDFNGIKIKTTEVIDEELESRI